MVAESALSPSQGLWIWLHRWQTGIVGQKVRLIDLPIPIRSSDIDSIFRLFRSIQLVDVRFQFLYRSIVLVYFKFQSFHRPILFLGFKFRFLYRVGKTFYLEIFVALSKEFSDWSRFYRFIGVGNRYIFEYRCPPLQTGRGKLRTRDNLLMGEGTGAEPNHTTSIRPQENFVLYKSFNLA